MDAIARFDGFPAGTLPFLAGLAAHNDKAWFEAHRSDYDACYVAPARAFVLAMGAALARFAPRVHAEPKVGGSLMRINRDIRFSRDKSPYKTHLDLWFWEGPERGWQGSGLWFRLRPRTLMLGAGIHVFSKEMLPRYRRAVDDERTGKTLVAALAKVRAAGCEVGGRNYKRVPRGFPPDHPRAGLLMHDGLYAGMELPVPGQIRSAAFVKFCTDRWRKMMPLHEWLAALAARGPRSP